jgi:hypothetical protein
MQASIGFIVSFPLGWLVGMAEYCAFPASKKLIYVKKTEKTFIATLIQNPAQAHFHACLIWWALRSIDPPHQCGYHILAPAIRSYSISPDIAFFHTCLACYRPCKACQ